jgi:hypothetical protein
LIVVVVLLLPLVAFSALSLEELDAPGCAKEEEDTNVSEEPVPVLTKASASDLPLPLPPLRAGTLACRASTARAPAKITSLI